jgi:hypothetical protein
MNTSIFAPLGLACNAACHLIMKARQDTKRQELRDFPALGFRIPTSGIDHIGNHWKHWNPSFLQGAFNKAIACGCRPCSQGGQDKNRVDSMLPRLMDNPLVSPRRVVQLLVHADRTAGKRQQRIIQAIADISVGSKGQVQSSRGGNPPPS